MRAFVVGGDAVFALKVHDVLLRNLVDCPTAHVVPLDNAEVVLAQVRPDVIVLILSPNPEVALARLHEIRSATQAHLIAVGPANEPKSILRTLHDGADEYLDEAELEYQLEGALARLRSKGLSHSEIGRVIALLAASGGSGSSTLAVNLATVLARQYKSTALFDLKLDAGDLPTLLDLAPTHTLADFCQNLARMDRSMFDQLFVKHASGVHLLAAPRRLADVAHVTPKGVRQAMVMARATFPYVVADIDHSFREEQSEALLQADVVLVILRLEIASVRNTGRTLEHLNQIGVTDERLRLVVNRYGQSKELPAATAEQALGMKLHYYISEDPKTVLRANNKGVPVVLDKPWAGVSKKITEMAISLNGRHSDRS